jgi:hypothetical protein
MAKSQIQLLTDAVEKLINNPVAPIAPVAPVAPVLPIVQQNSGDHDILTEFRSEAKVEFKNIKDTLLKLQEATIAYVTQPEHIEVLKRLDIIDVDIKVLQTTKNTQTVLLTIGSALLALLTSILIFHILGK